MILIRNGRARFASFLRLSCGAVPMSPKLRHRQAAILVIAPVLVPVQRCRIEPYLDQGGACGAAGPASAPGSALGGPPGARRAKSHRARRSKRLSRRAGRCCTECRLPRRTIIQFAATASMALPAVASHAIGFADHRPGVRSPGIGAYRGRREQSRIRPGQCQLHALVVVAKLLRWIHSSLCPTTRI